MPKAAILGEWRWSSLAEGTGSAGEGGLDSRGLARLSLHVASGFLCVVSPCALGAPSLH